MKISASFVSSLSIFVTITTILYYSITTNYTETAIFQKLINFDWCVLFCLNKLILNCIKQQKPKIVKIFYPQKLAIKPFFMYIALSVNKTWIIIIKLNEKLFIVVGHNILKFIDVNKQNQLINTRKYEIKKPKPIENYFISCNFYVWMLLSLFNMTVLFVSLEIN